MLIVLYLRSLSDPYQLTVYKAMCRNLRLFDARLFLIQGDLLDSVSPAQKSCFKYLPFLKADGVLFLSSAIISDSYIDITTLKKCILHLPCVSAGYPFPHIPSILIRSKNSLEKILEHLIKDHGYKSFLYIGGLEKHSDNKVRETVFREITSKYHLKTEIVYCNWLEEKTFSFMKEYTAQHPENPPDVIVAASDSMAIGVLKYLRSCDNPYWEHCPVTGFDDIPQAALQIPPLTTVSQPLNSLGELSLELICSAVKGLDVPDKIFIDTEPKIRNSCGCRSSISSSNTAVSDAMYRTMYTQKVQAEYYLNLVNNFAAILTNIDVKEDLYNSISSFLNQMEIKNFYFVSFNDNETEKWHESGKAKMLYYRENGVEMPLHNQEIDLGTFFATIKDHRVNCLAQLRAGGEDMGFILYDAPEEIQPHIYNAITFIENTLRRIQVLNNEKLRAGQLETEVMLRTKDLRNANCKLKQEATRRLAVEAEVLRISELERLRFSLDLHDDICQRLAGISMYCKGLVKPVSANETELTDLSSMIDETLTRTRAYAHDFFPLELDSLGLQEALEGLCLSVEKQTGCICLFLWKISNTVVFSMNKKMNIYRIFQEAIHNVIKHSKATKAKLTVSTKKKYVSFVLKDNGKGFFKKCQQSTKSNKKTAGLGLHSMEYRAHQIGADYILTSSPGKGTSIEIRLSTTEK